MNIQKIDNKKFLVDSKLAFTHLFESAKQKNELHYAFALSPEFRPYHYNTALEADIAFEQYLDFLKGTDYPKLRPRIALAFYCHLSEASGYWEIVKNMLSIANGECYKISPFEEFVKKHRESGKLIAPNANKIFQSIVGLANSLGNKLLAEVFRDAYSPIIRNGFSHADYVILEKGIAFENRYGKEHIMLWSEVNLLLNRGVDFYNCLRQVLLEHLKYYSNEKIVMGVLRDEPIAKWYIHGTKNSLKIGNVSFTNDHRTKNI